MEKIEIHLNEVVEKIEQFYDKELWMLNMVNALDTGECLEIQWFFSHYEQKNRTVCFFAYAGYDEEIPSIRSIIEPAWVFESECRDMLGANIEGTKKGIFLEDDIDFIPLRKEK